MEEYKGDKIQRVLGIYNKLMDGHIVSKAEEAARYGVNERSIQRDIDDIRTFLADERDENGTDGRDVVYSRTQNGYVMKGAADSLMSNAEVLAVSKILLESRAFTKEEMNSLLDKMIAGCVPQNNLKLVSDLILNEKFHYVELQNKMDVQDRVWQIGENIREHNLMKLTYQRGYTPGQQNEQIIEPLAILFSEYYFYLTGYIVKEDEQGNYVHAYDGPAVFRVDRIQAYERLDRKFRVNYADRFEEGEFRKRSQFMYGGELMKARFRYYSNNIEPVLDRLPTARILEQNGDEYLIEAETYGNGIVWWMLSQGRKVELLGPEGLMNEMKHHVERLWKRYFGGG